MGILDRIAEIEREISRTQKNKGNHCNSHLMSEVYLKIFPVFF